jgi:hypothetical protein
MKPFGRRFERSGTKWSRVEKSREAELKGIPRDPSSSPGMTGGTL